MTVELERVALVTGAARGIGSAIAAAPRARGLRGRAQRPRGELALDGVVAAAGPPTRRWRCPPTSPTRPPSRSSSPTSSSASARSTCSSTTPADRGDVAPLDELDQAAFERVLVVNLTGSFLCARAAAPHMRAAGWGRIVNVGSVTFHVGDHALRPLRRLEGRRRRPHARARRELGADGITVNAVSPGAIETERVSEPLPRPRGVRAREPSPMQALHRRGRPRTSRPRSRSSPPTTPASSPARRWRSTAAGRCSSAVAVRIIDAREEVGDVVSELGEGPFWDARFDVLRWVDILRGRVHGHSPTHGQLPTLELGRPVGFAVPDRRRPAARRRGLRPRARRARRRGRGRARARAGQIRHAHERRQGRPARPACGAARATSTASSRWGRSTASTSTGRSSRC